MIIDAMDLLYTQKYDAFALVSSDSDFTKLASRLRESEIFVFGVGEKKTPISFRNACDDFIFTENIGIDMEPKINKRVNIAAVNKISQSDKDSSSEVSSALKEGEMKCQDDEDSANIEGDPSELIPILMKAWEQYQNDDGWANVAPAGSFVKRSTPDFDPRTYGVTKLPQIIEFLKNDFEMKKYPGKGTVQIIAYRPKNTTSPQR